MRNTGFAVGFICISVLFLYTQDPFSVAVIQGCDPRLKSSNLPPFLPGDWMTEMSSSPIMSILSPNLPESRCPSPKTEVVSFT